MNNFDDLEIEEVRYLDRLRRFGKKIPMTKYEVLKSLEGHVSKINLNGTDYILKSSSVNQAIVGKASSDMYLKIGILTPMVHLFERNDEYNIKTIQKDVTTIAGMETILANDSMEFLEIKNNIFGRDRWGLFTNELLKNALLSFMTDECLEQLQNVYLIDELRTDTDRRLKNFFLCRTPGSKKYEGVIVIDLEEMIILNYCCSGWYDFNNFISVSYSSTTLNQKNEQRCYKYRMDDLRELIQSGYLTDNNINAIKNALDYNFPKEVEKLCKKCAIRGKQRNHLIDPIKKLWEYNNNTVGKEF